MIQLHLCMHLCVRWGGGAVEGVNHPCPTPMIEKEEDNFRMFITTHEMFEKTQQKMNTDSENSNFLQQPASQQIPTFNPISFQRLTIFVLQICKIQSVVDSINQFT